MAVALEGARGDPYADLAPTAGEDVSPVRRAVHPKADAEVAVYESSPFSEYAKLILKVSHSYGANLDVCLMAVEAGSTDCNDGFAEMKSFFEKAGVDGILQEDGAKQEETTSQVDEQ